MTKIKLSDTMEEALVYLGRGVYRAHLEPGNRTLAALESRGMIVWHTEAFTSPVHDSTRLWNVTLAGWAWLADQGIDRPADAGRMTLEEAWSDAEAETACDAWIAAIDRSLANSAKEDAEALMDATFDDGRYTLEEAWSDAYPMLADEILINTTGVDITGVTEALADDPRGYERGWDEGRYTLTEALAYAYTPGGQVACKHGRGMADTCDPCSDARFEKVHGLRAGHTAGQIYEEVMLSYGFDPDSLTFGMYKGVPIPMDVMNDWRGPLGGVWRRGVQSAQGAPQMALSAALPALGDPAYECWSCHWKFTSQANLENHLKGHQK